MRTPVASLLACLLLWPIDCAHSSQGQPPQPTAAGPSADGGAAPDAGFLGMPPGCEESLAGEWEHQDDPSYRYTAADDGGLLLLFPRRVTDEGGDAGATPEGMSIELQRSPAGFVGKFKMIEQLEGGKKCPASFDSHVVSCDPEKVTLRIEQSYAVDKDCKRVATGGSDVAEHVLVRRHPPAVQSGDAGEH
jgi:hypothetical protein